MRPGNPVFTDLQDLAQKYGSDKGAHGYCDFYEALLNHRRDEALRILELGVGGFEDPGDPAFGGASLRMWREYFPKSLVVGLDILDKTGVEGEGIKIAQGSQDDEALLERLSADHGPFDIIVDDASHIPGLTIRTFEILFPLLAPRGVYVIEDVSTSYWPLWGGRLRRNASGTTMALIKHRLDGLNHVEFKTPAFAASQLDESIVEIRARHNIVALMKGRNQQPSTMNHPHPISYAQWIRIDGLPALASYLRRPWLLRILERARLRSLASAARRTIVPHDEK